MDTYDMKKIGRAVPLEEKKWNVEYVKANTTYNKIVKDEIYKVILPLDDMQSDVPILVSEGWSVKSRFEGRGYLSYDVPIELKGWYYSRLYFEPILNNICSSCRYECKHLEIKECPLMEE